MGARGTQSATGALFPSLGAKEGTGLICFSISEGSGRYRIPFRKGNRSFNIRLWIIQTLGAEFLWSFRMKAAPSTPLQPAP